MSVKFSSAHSYNIFAFTFHLLVVNIPDQLIVKKRMDVKFEAGNLPKIALVHRTNLGR